MNLNKYLRIVALFVFVVCALSCSEQNEKSLEFVYPNGAIKALIMSYDDGVVEDIRLIKLFNENKIVGTFNLNSGYLGTKQVWPRKDADTLFFNYVPADSLSTIYANHEIAAHCTNHKDLKSLTDDAVLLEVKSDIENLTRLSNRKIVSLAYPFGNSNRHISELLYSTGLTNARTVNDTHLFNLPDTLMLWRPTCHDSRALELAEFYLAL